MRCTSPRRVGFKSDGKHLAWSYKELSKDYDTFQLPCGKCLECRLEYARQWAVRCVHESLLHENNIFLTLTYDDEHIGDGRLKYEHFQTFMKDLRDKVFREYLNETRGVGFWNQLSSVEKKCFRRDNKEELEKIGIGVFVTGEYGTRTKRAHWHACLFNYGPRDGVYKYTSDRGDKVWSSETLTEIWAKGSVEYGSVTLESAGYCARYAAKALAHGYDNEHDFAPISKKSSKYAIGRRYLERFWTDIFNYGEVVLPSGERVAMPRYYEKWLKKYRPDDWIKYLDIKLKRIADAERRQKKAAIRERLVNDKRAFRVFRGPQISQEEKRRRITKSRFKKLEEQNKF